MEIVIQQIEFKRIENDKLIEVQKEINDIRENNRWEEIVLCFKDGKLAYWSDKQTHEF